MKSPQVVRTAGLLFAVVLPEVAQTRDGVISAPGFEGDKVFSGHAVTVGYGLSR
jgi:hypothetical protein